MIQLNSASGSNCDDIIPTVNFSNRSPVQNSMLLLRGGVYCRSWMRLCRHVLVRDICATSVYYSYVGYMRGEKNKNKNATVGSGVVGRGAWGGARWAVKGTPT